MNPILRLLLSLSLSGSILTGLAYVLKSLAGRKLPKSFQYWIWIIVLLRFLIPFSFEASVMNTVFIDSSPPLAPAPALLPSPTSGGNLPVNPETNVEIVEGASRTDYTSQSLAILWGLGAFTVIVIHIIGYFRFNKVLGRTNKPAAVREIDMFSGLLKGRNRVKLYRNSFVTTPMLVGIIRPRIILPDAAYSDEQLKNILLHEVTHLKRFDLAVKWLAVFAVALHWFNPLVYLVKREMNRACELACDEKVLDILGSADKQAYGETLISVVAAQKCPRGALQATMCEEKESLKERVAAIVSHTRKSKLLLIVSLLIVLIVAVGALFIGGGISLNFGPANLYIRAQDSTTTSALVGSYTWKNKTGVKEDSALTASYGRGNTVTASPGEQLNLNIHKSWLEKKREFSIMSIAVYQDGSPVDCESLWSPPGATGNMYLHAPLQGGEYIYDLTLDFGEQGKVNYHFLVEVNPARYNLAEIAKYKTPYVGDHNKVLGITYRLPAPNYSHQGIALKTGERPYRLTVNYLSVPELMGGENEEERLAPIAEKNALVVFAMIDNLDEVEFEYAEGALDRVQLSYARADFEREYGTLTRLGENLDLLAEILGRHGD